ncbi:GPW/gp25 family protein [Actinoplanes sp. NPDC026623]|jgi:phage baseplate assembly protein W|uniref:GPW/gp25 family protein n=1 Tax=Actinoplanes sp. NPDC026623 TaxID=3155610 RepID=UPI0033D89C91
MSTGFGFPFAVTDGGIAPDPDDDVELRGKIIQVLFTAPGERVNQPEFGCGLFTLVFDPNNTIMAAAVEFTVGQALTRWLGDDLVVAGVDVAAEDEALSVEVAYVRRRDLARSAVRVQFR